MIKDNRIYFGYGTVAVSGFFTTLYLEEIRPPQKIGESIHGKDCEIMHMITIHAELEEYKKLQNELRNIPSKEDKIIEFNEYILDFTNYNFKSLQVVESAVYNIISDFLSSLAC